MKVFAAAAKADPTQNKINLKKQGNATPKNPLENDESCKEASSSGKDETMPVSCRSNEDKVTNDVQSKATAAESPSCLKPPASCIVNIAEFLEMVNTHLLKEDGLLEDVYGLKVFVKRMVLVSVVDKRTRKILYSNQITFVSRDYTQRLLMVPVFVGRTAYQSRR